MAQAIIEFKNVSKIFDKGKDYATQALRGITLAINPNEFIVLFGPSGSGKTTLLNVVAGLETFEEGDVLIRGESIKHKNEDQLAKHRREKIGMIFQQFNLLKNISVLENVALPELFANKPKRLRVTRSKELLREFGIEKFASRKPSELSGGQQQRVAIARALINNPWIILADEPTGNLDSKSANDVMKIFDSLHSKSKRTILMVTHNPDYRKYATRVFYFLDGKIVKIERRRG